MGFLTAIFLGILQGLTEFLPVSSSGHLALAQHFLKVKESGNVTFEIFLHLGTLLAVVIYFRKTILDLLLSLFRWSNSTRNRQSRYHHMLILYLNIATLATGVIYLIAGTWLESQFEKPLMVSFMLLITGAIVFASDFVRDGSIPASSMGIIRGTIIGLVQGLAIMPGISRSGSTIGSSVILGIKRKDAATFSFLLSIPAILAGNAKEFASFKALEANMLFTYVMGFMCAFVVGYLVIAFLIRLIENSRLKYFSYYCWFIGALSIILILT